MFSGLELDIFGASATTVVGPSGCGKTTLVGLITGLLVPQEGTITVDGLRPGDARRAMAVIGQDCGLFPWKTIIENAALGLIIRGVPKRRASEVAHEALAEMGMAALASRYPSQISGGQRQRVALARALSTNPRLLIMDEPFSALDALAREELQDAVLRLWSDREFTMLLVTHSIEEAVYLGQRVLVMGAGGCIAAIASPSMGASGYRTSSEFFDCSVKVRQALEGVEPGDDGSAGKARSAGSPGSVGSPQSARK